MGEPLKPRPAPNEIHCHYVYNPINSLTLTPASRMMARTVPLRMVYLGDVAPARPAHRCHAHPQFMGTFAVTIKAEPQLPYALSGE